MILFTFAVHFGEEGTCMAHFKEQRDKIGTICYRCSHDNHLLDKMAM